MSQSMTQSSSGKEFEAGKLLFLLVGAIGFEPTTPCAQGSPRTTYQ
jgi:hypothetical protein